MTAVGIVGGTGPLGRGLALRLALAGNDVVLGSRDAERAREAAEALEGVAVRGDDNAAACRSAEIVFVAVPYAGQADLLPALADACEGKVVVSTVVPMGFDDRGPHPLEVGEGSAAEQCQAFLPEARVVAGFQWVPAPKLLRRDPVEMDVPLCSDDDDAATQVAELAGDIEDLHGFVAGPLRLASSLERLTPLIVSTNKRHRAHLGVRFVGLRR